MAARPALRPAMQAPRHGVRSRAKPARRFQLRPRTKEGRSAERQKKLAQTTAMAPKRSGNAADSKAMDVTSNDMSLRQMRMEAMAETMEVSSGWSSPFMFPQTVGVFSDHFVASEEELGRGSIGTVRKCTERATGRVLACKSVSKAVLLPDQSTTARLHMELSVQSSLASHPNILELIGVYEDQYNVHIVTEFCGGGSLCNILQNGSSFGETETAWIFRRILRGVHACHLAGVMLRNLGPAAILLLGGAAGGEPQLADFSSAVQVSRGHGVTGVAGTLSHMAPEMLCGAVYGFPADIWSLGVLLFQLLAGYLPFRGEGPPQTMASICRAHLDFQESPWPSISAPVKALVRQMLARDARNRPTTEHLLHHPWLRHSGTDGGGFPSFLPLHAQPLHGFCSRPSLSTAISGTASSNQSSFASVYPLTSQPSNSGSIRHRLANQMCSFPQQMIPTQSMAIPSPLAVTLQTQLPTACLPSSENVYTQAMSAPSWQTVSSRPSGPALPLSPGLAPSVSTTSSGGDPESADPSPFSSSMGAAPPPLPLPWRSLSGEASPEPLFAHFDFPPMDLCLKPEQMYVLPPPSRSAIGLMDHEPTSILQVAVSNGPDLLSQTQKIENSPLGEDLLRDIPEVLPQLLDTENNHPKDHCEPLISHGIPASRSPSGTSDLTSVSPKGVACPLPWKKECTETGEMKEGDEKDHKRTENLEAQRESTYDFLCGLHDLAESWSKESVLAQLAT